jgi:hypothetical protein
MTIDESVSEYFVSKFLFNAYRRIVSPARAMVNRLIANADTTGKARDLKGSFTP